jgi:hypothetical protein
MLGHKETEIDDGHRLAKPRMKRGPDELGSAHPGEPVDDAAAHSAEVRENVGNWPIIVGGLVCFPILEIGRVQLGRAGVVIVEALVPQRFQVEEMARIFLDRPLAIAPFGEDFDRQAAHRAGQALRCRAKPFQKFRSSLRAEAQFKFAIEPASRCHSEQRTERSRGDKIVRESRSGASEYARSFQ